MAIHPSPEQRMRRPSPSVWVAASFFLLLPPVFFYSILLHTVLNIPFFDDYEAVLAFIDRLVQLHGISAKASWFLASQHHEYKLLFEQAVVWLQFELLGHISFPILCAAGNAFVLLLALLLWKIFPPAQADTGSRLALFVPVPWLLFQLEYHETLNWAMAGLQNLPVLVFAFGAIHLLGQPTKRAFSGALACFILAVASSGNGFLLIPIGLLILGLRRRYTGMTVWLVASAACILGYSYRYNVMSSQSVPNHSVFSTLLRLRPAYVVSFIGNAASIPFPIASFFLGITLCVFFIWMALRGYIRRNPVVSCCVLFLLLTAVGVAGIRSDLGLAQSLSSRYTIYSALFLIFAWFMIVEEFILPRAVTPLRNGLYIGSVAASVLFSIYMDTVGIQRMKDWNSQLVQGMAAFEHPNPPGSTEGPNIPSWKGYPKLEAFNSVERTILFESIRLGVYRPPPLEAPRAEGDQSR